MDPMVARRTWRTLEPVHGMIYFVPEATQAYAQLGVIGRTGYFASRAAPMGAVGSATVVATFFNFQPALVHAAVGDVWSRVTPQQLVDARLEAVDAALRRALDRDIAGDDMRRAAALARAAAEEAAGRCEGRPLAAGHVDLPWPDAAHLVLWHAQSILREYRGDGHLAALVGAGIDGCEALVLHAATGQVPRVALQTTRGWTDDEWAAAVERLRSRGLVDGAGEFTDAGRTLRESIESATDSAAVAPYAALGEARCGELRAAGRPLSQAVMAAGLLPL